MISIERHLFWVLQEEDINNEKLFFPPDTPVGHITLIKSKSKLQRRHERQLRRLEEQQLQELSRFQKKFSERYDHQVYMNAPPPLCEFVDGMEFLNEFGAEISNLVNIDLNTLQNEQLNAEQLAEENSQNDMKSMIEARKQDYALAFRRRFRSSLETLEKNHKQQLEYLKSMQEEELTKLNNDIIDQSLQEIRLKEQEETRLKRIKEYEREALDKEEKAKQSQRQGDNDNNAGPSKKRLANTNEESYMNSTMSSKKKAKPVINRAKSGDGGNIINTPLVRGPSAATAIRPPAPTNRGPPVPTAIRPSIPISRGPPPVVATATPHKQQPSSPAIPTVTVSNYLRNPQGKKRQSDIADYRQNSTPLFRNKKANRYATTVLTDIGSICIKRNPPRVIIRKDGGSQVIGNPKDYDDAINGYARTKENPITKRQYFGKPHLFFKTDTGEILNVGPVEKIQPLISSFLLSL